jgi:hypothetical protein
MKFTIYIALAFFTAACVSENQNSAVDRSDFAVVRNGIDMDVLAITCANDPGSVGFATSQDCFSYARDLMENSQ